MKKFAQYVHLDLFYVLDYSGSFDIHMRYMKYTKMFDVKYQREILCFECLPVLIKQCSTITRIYFLKSLQSLYELWNI